jgi:hypothetical protein
MPETTPTLFSRAVAVLTALASVVGFVYLLGAAVLWVRLSREHFPPEPVIVSLPRELLLSVGLRTIVLPALAYAVLASLVILLVKTMGRAREVAAELVDALFGEETAHPYRHQLRSALELLLFSQIGGVTSLAILGGFLLVKRSGFNEAVWWAIGAIVVILVAAVIASRWPAQIGKLGNVLRIAVLVSVVAAIVRLGGEFVDPQFAQVTVCTKDGKTFSGLFIAETDSGAYLGDKAKRTVIELPRERFNKLLISHETPDCSG